MKIGSRHIGNNYQPFVVAELSGNHNQSLDRGLALVEAAARAGAHAIKLQTYTAETMTLNVDRAEFLISEESSIWKGRSLHELYQMAHTPWDWHAPLFKRAGDLGLTAFSTPFDETAVEFLERMNVPCYKIASFENTDLPLIRQVAATGKPVIVSTGMATIAELDETVQAARSAGCKDFVLLKCTSAYPASPEDANLLTIPDMRARYACEVGISDHTMGIGVAVASVALGAAIVEKHFILDRSNGGVDAEFSMEPDELAQLVAETDRAWRALGTVRYGTSAADEENKAYRRSIYVVRNMTADEVFSKDNVRCIRPALGLAPKYLSDILGRRATTALAKGTPLSWDVVKAADAP